MKGARGRGAGPGAVNMVPGQEARVGRMHASTFYTRIIHPKYIIFDILLVGLLLLLLYFNVIIIYKIY